MTVALVMIFALTTFAYEGSSEVESKFKDLKISNYKNESGIFNGNECEIVTYVENGVSKKVIKVFKTSEMCDFYTYENGKLVSKVVDFPVTLKNGARITYPHYTDYWYAGTDYYSTKVINSSVSAIAGAIAYACGMPASGALNVASQVYGLMSYFYDENCYYSTTRYYATMEYGIGEPTIYYSKFVTKTYKNSDYTGQVGSAVTDIYEGLSPM